MAKTKAEDRMPDEAAAADWAKELRTTGDFVSDPQDQQVEVHQPVTSPIDEAMAKMTKEAAARAANYVAAKKAGPAMTQIIGYIAAKAVDTAELNTVISEQLAVRILNAQSADDIFDPFSTARDKDFVGKPLYVEGCMFLESDKGDGFPWYVALDVRDQKTGALAPIIVGGEKLVPQVAGLDMHDAWPVVIQIESTETRKGFIVYGLVPPVKY